VRGGARSESEQSGGRDTDATNERARGSVCDGEQCDGEGVDGEGARHGGRDGRISKSQSESEYDPASSPATDDEAEATGRGGEAASSHTCEAPVRSHGDDEVCSKGSGSAEKDCDAEHPQGLDGGSVSSGDEEDCAGDKSASAATDASAADRRGAGDSEGEQSDSDGNGEHEAANKVGADGRADDGADDDDDDEDVGLEERLGLARDDDEPFDFELSDDEPAEKPQDETAGRQQVDSTGGGIGGRGSSSSSSDDSDHSVSSDELEEGEERPAQRPRVSNGQNRRQGQLRDRRNHSPIRQPDRTEDANTRLPHRRLEPRNTRDVGAAVPKGSGAPFRGTAAENVRRAPDRRSEVEHRDPAPIAPCLSRRPHAKPVTTLQPTVDDESAEINYRAYFRGMARRLAA